MSSFLPAPVTRAIEAFSRFPGIGSKMAARLVMHLLSRSARERESLAQSVTDLTDRVQTCSICGFLTTESTCAICQDASREDSICVVQGPLDVVALEKSGAYRGKYHVLGGLLSPLDGIGPEELRIALLLSRVREALADRSAPLEVLLATNPSLEGEATSQYMHAQLHMINNPLLRITRIARGLPVGSDIEYADPATLSRALEGRNNLS